MKIELNKQALFLLAFFAALSAAESAWAAPTSYLNLRGQVRGRMEAYLRRANASAGTELYNQSNQTIIVEYSDGLRTKKIVVKPRTQVALSDSVPATVEYLQILAP